MDRDALRAMQAPLKERYRDEPDAALVTLSATGSLDDGIACSVRTGREQIATLVKLTERYCVVLQTLRGGAELTVGATRA